MFFFWFIWVFGGAIGAFAFFNELDCFDANDEEIVQNLKTLHPLTYPIVLLLSGPLVWVVGVLFTMVGIIVFLFSSIVKLGKRAMKKDVDNIP